MRIIAVFEKSVRLRHIGHLDIQRAVQRGLRRSGLPVAYSQGFNPHILVTFASALSTGACGEREIMDVRMAEEVDAAVFVESMNRAMPKEMQILEARAVDDRHPALSAEMKAAAYDLLIRDPETAQRITDAIPLMMSRTVIPAIRKTKTGRKECDIRPLIYGISTEGQHVFATMKLTEQEACKPDMLLSALSAETGLEDPPRVLITRKALYGENEAGELEPLERL